MSGFQLHCPLPSRILRLRGELLLQLGWLLERVDSSLLHRSDMYGGAHGLFGVSDGDQTRCDRYSSVR